MKNCTYKKVSAFLLVMMLFAFTCVSYIVPGASLSVQAFAASTSNQFALDMNVVTNADDSSQLDVVITIKDIQQELYAVEFLLDFDDSLVTPVVTQSGEAMDCFMSVKPMYTFVIPGSSGAELQVSRYEQICYYDSINTLYECRFADLLQYANAKEGETYNGLLNDGELVITIPFKLVDGVAANTDIEFTTSNVKGTAKAALVSVTGIADSAVYTIPEEEIVLPNIGLKYPTLLLEDEIIMSVYFTLDQELDLSKVGLLTWSYKPTTVSVDSAEAVIPGATFNSNGFYSVHTNPIPAKNLGDDIYFCIYAQLENGSYVYSKQVDYSPSRFAYSQINSAGASAESKSLMVAMLNYGGAAQTYFGYKTDALVNGSLTAEQRALVKEYSADMVNGIDPVDSSKIGPYTATGGFTRKYPTVSLEGAFCINYYFELANTPDATVTLFYWTEADYSNATTLSPTNASGKFNMGSGMTITGVVEGIAAQNLDDTIYVVAGYRSDGVSYCTGVLPYSIGAYCVSQVSNAAAEMKPVASAIAVYGYYAKAYFSSI